MKLTDGKRTVEITMCEWNDKQQGYTPDWSADFFAVKTNEDGIGVVEDVDYCIEQAYDWQHGDGDYAENGEPYEDWSSGEPELIYPDLSNRVVTVEDVSNTKLIEGMQNIVDASQWLDKYSPEFLEVFCNKNTKDVWAIRQVSMGHEAVTEYSDPAIVKIGNLIEPMTMQDLQDGINRQLEKDKPLMQRLVDAGYADKISHHYSDLYVEVTAGTDKIIKDWMQDNGYRTDKAGMKHWAPTFRDNITGKLTFDVPFQYNPYYEAKAAEKSSVLKPLREKQDGIAQQGKDSPAKDARKKDDREL